MSLIKMDSTDEPMHREQAIKWYQNIKYHVENKEPMQVKLFVIQNKIQLNRYKIESILQWMCNVKKMIWKVEKLQRNDTRCCFGSNKQ